MSQWQDTLEKNLSRGAETGVGALSPPCQNASFDPNQKGRFMSSEDAATAVIEIGGMQLLPSEWTLLRESDSTARIRVHRVEYAGDGQGNVLFKYLASSGNGELCLMNGETVLWRFTSARPPWQCPIERGLIENCGFDSIEEISRLLGRVPTV